MSYLTLIARKRLIFDRKNFINDTTLAECNIYADFPEDLTKAYVMIIGPEDTPYYGGFYFFDFSFPENYPFAPPHVKYMTQGENCRFNPNLYVNGKVCLSILGTWSGPGWTSVQNISSVSLAIQSLLNENPLENEPSYEGAKTPRHINYRNYVEYQSLNVATLNMLKGVSANYQCFMPIMQKFILENKTKYDNKLADILKLKFTSSKVMYGMSTSLIKFNRLKTKYNNYFNPEAPTPIVETATAPLIYTSKSLSIMRIPQLKAILKQQKKTISGNKAILINRIING
jgi:ubiquitin-protein ligase